MLLYKYNITHITHNNKEYEVCLYNNPPPIKCVTLRNQMNHNRRTEMLSDSRPKMSENKISVKHKIRAAMRSKYGHCLLTFTCGFIVPFLFTISRLLICRLLTEQFKNTLLLFVAMATCEVALLVNKTMTSFVHCTSHDYSLASGYCDKYRFLIRIVCKTQITKFGFISLINSVKESLCYQTRFYWVYEMAMVQLENLIRI